MNGVYKSSTIYYWGKLQNNIWSASILNTTNLNTNFINNIGSVWSNKITITTWKVAGNKSTNICDVVAKTAYTNEITSTSTTYDAKIGLMYASDYGFAADPSAWTTTLANYSESVNESTISLLNWMYLGSSEWTISRNAAGSNGTFEVTYDGNLDSELTSIPQ